MGNTPAMMNTGLMNRMAEQYVKENPEAATRSSGPTISNLGCPDCAAGGKEVPLQTQFGVFGYTCAGGHRFLDTEELMARKPKQLANAAPMPVKPPSADVVAVQVNINGKVAPKLQERFGAQLNGTIASVLEALCHPASFVVGGDEANQMSQHLGLEAGQKVNDCQRLLGLIYALRQDRDLVKQELATLRNSGSSGAVVSETGVMVDLGASYMERLNEKAKFNGMPSDKFIRGVIQFALDNSWV